MIVGIGNQVATIDGWGWYVYRDRDYRELGNGVRATRLELVDDTSDFVTITITPPAEVGS